jgi:hypothetical protein
MRAWYVAPTGRYQHGILGDAIEAGGLSVEHSGASVTLLLDETSVFEDIQPRLQDLTGDGVPEIITIESHRDRGARVAIYRLTGSTLSLYSASAPIGRPRRWLNIAGVRDFDRDGTTDIAWVETPHIGGVLKIASVRPGRLAPAATHSGVSNHKIGSRNLCLSVVTEDGLILPRQDYGGLLMLAFDGGRITVARRFPGAIDPGVPLTRQVAGVTPLTDVSCVSGR